MTNERGLLIRCIVSFYAVGIGLFAADLSTCEWRRPGSCDTSRARLEGAIAAGPTALLALLVKSSPMETTHDPNPPVAVPPRRRRASQNGDGADPTEKAPRGLRGR